MKRIRIVIAAGLMILSATTALSGCSSKDDTDEKQKQMQQKDPQRKEKAGGD